MAKLDAGDKFAAATLAASKVRDSDLWKESEIFEVYQIFLRLFSERADNLAAGNVERIYEARGKAADELQ